jgi:putative endonuclease
MKDLYVYILKGHDGNFYKGFTNNLEKRLYQHELGQNETTKKMKSFSLIHVEICKTRIEARKLERFFKSGFGREIIKELFNC